MEDWVEESGMEINPAVVKEIYPSTWDEALEMINAARALGFGVQFRNQWERHPESTTSFSEGFEIIVYEDLPLSVPDEDDSEA